MTVLLACDRTGGHVYPAEILARHIIANKENVDIVFYGVRAKDAQRLSKDGFVVCGVELKTRNIFIEGFIRFFEALYILFRFMPSRVICFGGRCGFFITLIASLVCRTAIYEPNAVYGKTNKVLSFFVNKIFLGLRKPLKKKERKVGVPLRSNILRSTLVKSVLIERFRLDPNKKIILVFGGSSGSSAINEAFSICCVKTDILDNAQAIHITGTSEFYKIKNLYRQEKKDVRVVEYYEAMEELYCIADVIVSRTGASTLAELDYVFKPVIAVPYPYAYNHQFYNAGILSKNRSDVVLIEQKTLSPENLYKELTELLSVESDSIGINTDDKLWEKPSVFAEEIVKNIL